MKMAAVIGAISIFLIAATPACSDTVFTTQFFTFPPGSAAHEDSWEYRGTVVISQEDSGALTNRSRKNVKMVVIDRKNEKILQDDFYVEAGAVSSIIEWSQFGQIQVGIYESESYGVKDGENRKTKIAGITYSYDEKKGRFFRDKQEAPDLLKGK